MEMLSKVAPLRGSRITAVPTEADHQVGSSTIVGVLKKAPCCRDCTNILKPQVPVQREGWKQAWKSPEKPEGCIPLQRGSLPVCSPAGSSGEGWGRRGPSWESTG